MDIPDLSKNSSLTYIVKEVPPDVSFNDIIDISEELRNINEFYRSQLLTELHDSVFINANERRIDDIYNIWKYLSMYNDRKRFYHNIHHIIYCIETLYEHWDELNSYISFSEFVTIKIALIFHDIIYTTKGKEQKYKNGGSDVLDEEMSAKIAIKLLNPFFNNGDSELAYIDLNLIADLIRATNHSARYSFTTLDNDEPNSMLKAIMCDIDLYILSSSDREFEKYRNNVRKEYSHIDAEMWNEGSNIFANHFLFERESIYSSPVFEKYEEQARKNLKKLLIKEQVNG